MRKPPKVSCDGWISQCGSGVQSQLLYCAIPRNYHRDSTPGCRGEQRVAWRQVNSTTLSRALLQAPVYLVPPMLIAIPFKRFVTMHPTLTVPLTTYCLLVCFGIGLPATVAVFPQIAEIDPKDVDTKKMSKRKPNEGQSLRITV
mmetsp:Transcript_10673/g.13016  ORF Transcript_10673/g.13016 Transcript_10673/m.13016 type:complete len:144 (-) Transcript_10673:31-462(-)